MASKRKLRQQFHTSQLKAGDSFTVYSAINSMARKLQSMGEQITESEKLAALLNGLPDSFDPIVTVVECLTDITYSEACIKIQDFVEKKQLRGGINEEGIYYADSRTKQKDHSKGWNNDKDRGNKYRRRLNNSNRTYYSKHKMSCGYSHGKRNANSSHNYRRKFNSYDQRNKTNHGHANTHRKRNKTRCNYCNRLGHIQSRCWIK